MEKEVINVAPKLPPHQRKAFLVFCENLKRKIGRKSDEERLPFLIEQKKELNKADKGKGFHSRTDLIFVKNLLLDLLLQDWVLIIKNKKVSLQLETLDGKDRNVNDEKAKTRRRHLLARDVQLRGKTVTEFIKGMETKTLTDKGWHSIFSVMRDGSELKKILQTVGALTNDAERIAALEKTVQPYIQIVEPGRKCAQTGLPLNEIWRYFRHTWSTEYKSLPGRSISILIRDRAAPNHPVIGIAALGSSVAQQTCRDEWIGWDGSTFLNKLKSEPSIKYSKWISDILKMLLKEIYLKDFFARKFISKEDLSEPSLEKVKKLRDLSLTFRKRHVNNPQKSKFTADNELSWEERANTNLFKSKRAVLLAELLSIKIVFKKYGFTGKSKDELEKALTNNDFQDAVYRLVRKAKSIHVGINMMDIIVCGSIPPYNHLLGGKLVCMLLASPEITQYYNKKYSDAVSLIASSMRGKPVTRKPQLVMLGTTSLYGVGSSQYNRIKIPVKEIGGESDLKVEYQELGFSEGYGSFHFSSNTIALADAVTGRENGRTKVNSIFGEGANPLLRKLKDAMEYLKLESNPILNHRNKRVVYGISLAQNFGEILLGIASRPKYLIPQEKAKVRTDLIGRFWIKRWLLNRIQNPDVLAQVGSHSLAYPIVHGARVPMEVEENSPSIIE